MLGKKNLDELSQPAREFYERARMKMTMSLILISMALFFIGLCCLAGGQSLGNDKFKDSFPGGQYFDDGVA
ncbi:hypothetical protein EON65_44010 [archaeon]|nr:MAG: hypothetical protein EON65_44010 [archaeon]